jgi:hypothetical protein
MPNAHGTHGGCGKARICTPQSAGLHCAALAGPQAGGRTTGWCEGASSPALPAIAAPGRLLDFCD